MFGHKNVCILDGGLPAWMVTRVTPVELPIIEMLTFLFLILFKFEKSL